MQAAPLRAGRSCARPARLSRSSTTAHPSLSGGNFSPHSAGIADPIVVEAARGARLGVELHKINRTLPDEDARADGDLRIVDESGGDYLFPAVMFVPINPPDQVRSSLLRASSS